MKLFNGCFLVSRHFCVVCGDIKQMRRRAIATRLTLITCLKNSALYHFCYVLKSQTKRGKGSLWLFHSETDPTPVPVRG